MALYDHNSAKMDYSIMNKLDNILKLPFHLVFKIAVILTFGKKHCKSAFLKTS